MCAYFCIYQCKRARTLILDKDHSNSNCFLYDGYLLYCKWHCFFCMYLGTLGQSSGDLRLYTSKSYSSAGRLEMYYSSTWTPFTIDGFDMHQADLACKKLGYSYASRYENVDSLGYVSRYLISSLYKYFKYRRKNARFNIFNFIC